MKASRGVLVGAVGALAVAACFVDLDPPLGAIEPIPDTGAPDNTLGPSNVDSDIDTGLAPECFTEADCNPGTDPAVACLGKSCVSGRCEYTTCGASGVMCADHQSCDRTTGNCSASPVGFEAGHFDITLKNQLDGALAFQCTTSTSPTRCFAAVWPFLIVAQPTDPPSDLNAFAYDVSDPTNPIPDPIAINGVDFPSLAVVASGRRVYFVDQSTTNPKVAWVDVPSNPFVKTMNATSVPVTYPASVRPLVAHPAPNAGLYIGGTNGVIGRFDPGTITTPFQMNAVTKASASATAVDDDRVYYQSSTTNGPLVFGNAANPGKNVAAFNGFVDSGIAPLRVPVTFASSPNGILANAATVRDAGADGAPRLDAVTLAHLDPTPSTTTYLLQKYADAAVQNAAGNLVSIDGGALAIALKDDSFSPFATRIDFAAPDASVTLDIDAGDAGLLDLYPVTSNGYVYIIHWMAKSRTLNVDIVAESCPK